MKYQVKLIPSVDELSPNFLFNDIEAQKHYRRLLNNSNIQSIEVEERFPSKAARKAVHTAWIRGSLDSESIVVMVYQPKSKLISVYHVFPDSILERSFAND